jgi:hypothetical protein
VCDTSRGGPAAYAHEPLPKYSRVDQRLAPEHFGQARLLFKKVSNCLVWDFRDRAGPKAPEGVVHLVQRHALQVGDIARQTERHDLTFTRFYYRITECEPFHDHADEVAVVAFPDNVLSPSNIPNGDRKPFNGTPLGCVERVISL